VLKPIFLLSIGDFFQQVYEALGSEGAWIASDRTLRIVFVHPLLGFPALQLPVCGIIHQDLLFSGRACSARPASTRRLENQSGVPGAPGTHSQKFKSS
jgi:hypothetical protein